MLRQREAVASDLRVLSTTSDVLDTNKAQLDVNNERLRQQLKQMQGSTCMLYQSRCPSQPLEARVCFPAPALDFFRYTCTMTFLETGSQTAALFALYSKLPALDLVSLVWDSAYDWHDSLKRSSCIPERQVQLQAELMYTRTSSK
eukprot:6206660-Pleurochrysis_carterae.AAC.2